MKVLLVNGSPKKEGTTNAALTHAAKSLENEGVCAEIFWIGNQVAGCMACGGCREAKKCVIDDVVNEFNQKALEADGFVFASPVHFAGASGNVTSFLDRAFYSENYGSGRASYRLKPAAVVAIARRAGTTATLDQLVKYPTIAEMPVISASYWNIAFGAKAADIEQDAEGIHTMQVLGKNMAYFIKCIKAGEKSGVQAPEKTKKPFTNFVR